MNRQRYVLRTASGVAVAEISAPEDQAPELEPWMIENINARGWTVEKFPVVSKVDVEIHGVADWRAVAEELAMALRPILDDNRPAESEEEVEEIFGQAQQALDRFDVTMMEVGLISLAEDPRGEEDESGD